VFRRDLHLHEILLAPLKRSRTTLAALPRASQGMILVVVLATLFRLLLIAFNWPVTNSDEGNMGIVGRHIAFEGAWPIFFYGLPYMGPVEGYLAAPLFSLFDSSLFLLRLPLVLLYSGFLIGMYYLVRLLYDEKYALASIVLLSLGSPEMILRQVKAVGEYPEMAIGAALIPLLAAWLAMTGFVQGREKVQQAWRKRTLLFGILGLIMGVSLWIDFLILPFVGAAGLLLLIFCRSERAGWLALILGGLVGIAPLIVYNLSAPLSQNSLAVLLSLHQVGAEEMLEKGLTQWHKLVGTIMIALPLQTGAFPRPLDSEWPVFGKPTPGSIAYATYYIAWGIGFLALLIFTTIMSVRAILSQRRSITIDEQKRYTFVRECARFMLLLSACLTLLQYMTSSHGAVYPVTSARYLTCLVNVIPLLLWPLWKSAVTFRQVVSGGQRVRRLLSWGALGLIVVVYLSGTAGTIAEIPMAYQQQQRNERIVNTLLSLNTTRVYSEYWTCNNVTFQSRERIICSALEENLEPGFNRYAPYADLVRQEPRPTYLFPRDAPQLQPLERQLQGKDYQRLALENYIIYYPKL
jgi:hypothetical protein